MSSHRPVSRRFALACTVSLPLLLAACGGAKVTHEAAIGPAPTVRPVTIYVADFDLDVGEVQSQGIGSVVANNTIIGSLPHPLGLLPSDKQTTAHHLVDLTATSLVKDLTGEGFQVQRISADAPLPADGWLLRGVFTEVDEGSRLRRAIIGFGAGKTDLQVMTKMDDLAAGPPQPFYEVDTQAHSGSMPGAVVTMSPAAAALKFVIAKGDLDRNTRDTATQIAKAVAGQVPR